jgi:hypothetical protein
VKAVLDLFREVIQLVAASIPFAGRKEDVERIETSKQAYEWFLEQLKDDKSTRVQVNKDPLMQPGKIYIFKYDAKYKDSLSYWDKHPIVLAIGTVLGESGKMTIGVNISWYPPSARKFIVERIRKIYEPKYNDSTKKYPMEANRQNPVYLDLFQLKNIFDDIGFSFAIRQYIPQNIKAPKVCVCYEDWDKAIMLDQPRIFPELQINDPYYSLRNIYEEFKNHVRYVKENRAMIKEKRDKAKAAGKFKFIK